MGKTGFAVNCISDEEEEGSPYDGPNDQFIIDDSETDFKTVTFFNSSNPSPNSTINSANINRLLEKLGLKVKKECLDACLIALESTEEFHEMDDPRKALLCLDKFLTLDMKEYSAGVLPTNVQKMDSVDLKGPFMLQVNEMLNVCGPDCERFKNVAAGYDKRMLKLSMTDGVRRVLGMEYMPINDLEVLSPAGLKVLVSNVRIMDGILLLVPEAVVVFGGYVEKFEAARQSFINEMNKPRPPWEKWYDFKREGAGGWPWGCGIQTDEQSPVAEEVVNEDEKIVKGDNTSREVEEAKANKDKEIARNEVEEKEPEDKVKKFV